MQRCVFSMFLRIGYAFPSGSVGTRKDAIPSLHAVMGWVCIPTRERGNEETLILTT